MDMISGTCSVFLKFLHLHLGVEDIRNRADRMMKCVVCFLLCENVCCFKFVICSLSLRFYVSSKKNMLNLYGTIPVKN